MTSIEHIRAKIVEFIIKHEPDKTDIVAILMKKWKGKENDLLKTLCEKYKEKYTKMRPKSIISIYSIGSCIGYGFGSQRIKKCKRRKDGVIFALEIINKKQLNKENLVKLESTINIMRQISHPNIIKLYNVFDSRAKMCLIVDLMDGGELFDHIIQKSDFSEIDASILIGQICEALHYLHQHSIVYHLKPENISVCTKQNDSTIKLIDFHSAVSCKNDDLCTQITAYDSPCYVAPEILSKSKYNTQVGMWSLGVISYIILCGFPPFFDVLSTFSSKYDEYVMFGFIRETTTYFPHQTNSFYIIPQSIVLLCLQFFGNHCNKHGFMKKRLFQTIIRGKYNMPSPHWDNISTNAKDLIRRLLETDPKKRLTASDTLQHPWFKCKSWNSLGYNHRIQLKRFQYIQRVRRGVKTILAVLRLIEVMKNW